MDRAFALDKLHEDPSFRAVTAVAPSPEQQLALGMESASAFLSDMDRLSDSESERPLDTVAMRKAAANTSDNNASTRKPKLSSYKRVRRAKTTVQRQIAQLEQQIDCIRSAHFEKLARIYAKRWEATFLREVRRTGKSEAEQLRLLQQVDLEQQRSKAVQDTIDRMRISVPVGFSSTISADGARF